MNKVSFSNVFDVPEEWHAQLSDSQFASNLHKVILTFRGGMLEYGAQQAGTTIDRCELLNFSVIPVVQNGRTVALVFMGDVITMPVVEVPVIEVPSTPIVYRP